MCLHPPGEKNTQLGVFGNRKKLEQKAAQQTYGFLYIGYS